jgi:hypothetical protein
VGRIICRSHVITQFLKYVTPSIRSDGVLSCSQDNQTLSKKSASKGRVLRNILLLIYFAHSHTGVPQLVGSPRLLVNILETTDRVRSLSYPSLLCTQQSASCALVLSHFYRGEDVPNIVDEDTRLSTKATEYLCEYHFFPRTAATLSLDPLQLETFQRHQANHNRHILISD